MTGRVEEKLPNPMEGMTEEQKEHEAMKLVNMFDKLSRYWDMVFVGRYVCHRPSFGYIPKA